MSKKDVAFSRWLNLSNSIQRYPNRGVLKKAYIYGVTALLIPSLLLVSCGGTSSSSTPETTTSETLKAPLELSVSISGTASGFVQAQGISAQQTVAFKGATPKILGLEGKEFPCIKEDSDNKDKKTDANGNITLDIDCIPENERKNMTFVFESKSGSKFKQTKAIGSYVEGQEQEVNPDTYNIASGVIALRDNGSGALLKHINEKHDPAIYDSQRAVLLENINALMTKIETLMKADPNFNTPFPEEFPPPKGVPFDEFDMKQHPVDKVYEQANIDSFLTDIGLEETDDVVTNLKKVAKEMVEKNPLKKDTNPIAPPVIEGQPTVNWVLHQLHPKTELFNHSKPWVPEDGYAPPPTSKIGTGFANGTPISLKDCEGCSFIDYDIPAENASDCPKAIKIDKETTMPDKFCLTGGSTLEEGYPLWKNKPAYEKAFKFEHTYEFVDPTTGKKATMPDPETVDYAAEYIWPKGVVPTNKYPKETIDFKDHNFKLDNDTLKMFQDGYKLHTDMKDNFHNDFKYTKEMAVSDNFHKSFKLSATDKANRLDTNWEYTIGSLDNLGDDFLLTANDKANKLHSNFKYTEDVWDNLHTDFQIKESDRAKFHAEVKFDEHFHTRIKDAGSDFKYEEADMDKFHDSLQFGAEMKDKLKDGVKLKTKHKGHMAHDLQFTEEILDIFHETEMQLSQYDLDRIPSGNKLQHKHMKHFKDPNVHIDHNTFKNMFDLEGNKLGEGFDHLVKGNLSDKELADIYDGSIVDTVKKAQEDFLKDNPYYNDMHGDHDDDRNPCIAKTFEGNDTVTNVTQAFNSNNAHHDLMYALDSMNILSGLKTIDWEAESLTPATITDKSNIAISGHTNVSYHIFKNGGFNANEINGIQNETDATKSLNTTAIAGSSKSLVVYPSETEVGGVKFTMTNPVKAIGGYLLGTEEGKRYVKIAIEFANGSVEKHIVMRNKKGVGGVSFQALISDTSKTECRIKSIKYELELSPSGSTLGRDIFGLDDLHYVE